MKVSVIGAGTVGLVTAATIAALGHQVSCVESRRKVVQNLKKGIPPFKEHGLQELISRSIHQGTLSFTTELEESVSQTQVIFICVGTPELPDGSTNLTEVKEAVVSIAPFLENQVVIVIRSTVPPGTCASLKRLLGRSTDVPFDLVSNPDFFSKGTAVNDMLHPDRIVVGIETDRALVAMKTLYKKLNAPWHVTSLVDAELIKYASSCFLALKLTYVNELSRLCDRLGADIMEVTSGMGSDHRIGPYFLRAGIGFGGPHLLRDLHGLQALSKELHCPLNLLQTVEEINQEQPEFIIRKIEKALNGLEGKLIAIWGLAFKPRTAELRSSPALTFAKILQAKGAKIQAYDPGVFEAGLEIGRGISLCNSAYTALENAHVLAVCTDWEEFKDPNWQLVKIKLRKPVVVDGCNMYQPEKLAHFGLQYLGLGRRQ